MSNPLFAIDAGHYIDTPGKRCLKSIDPGETREWVLNSRIADKVQERLRGYRCATMRVDDVTGEKEISLSKGWRWPTKRTRTCICPSITMQASTAALAGAVWSMWLP